MRELSVLAVVAAALAVVALSIFGLGDRTTLTSPPEAVAEEFVRRLAGHRPERARNRLSERLRPACSANKLSAWFRDVEAVVDPIEEVEGKDSTVADGEAWATVAVRNGDRKVEVRLALVREHGDWKIARLPASDEFAP